jgi:hypothetical protein
VTTLISQPPERSRSVRGRFWGRVRDAVPDWLALSLRYRRVHGRFPNLVAPATFSEKILWRAAFDRRPLLADITDKARAREYVCNKIGTHCVPRLYWSTVDPASIPFDDLPARFVVKPTHGSGWVQVVHDKSALDRESLLRLCKRWLETSYHGLSREWIYKGAVPRIHVEEYIDDGQPDAPLDYKVSVFGGTSALIQVDAGRFSDHRRSLYTRDWERLDVTMTCAHPGSRPPGPIERAVPRPANLDRMLAAAEQIGRDFDFVRVDCFDSPAGFVINELTATPGRGMIRFDPVSFDEDLGARWILPRWMIPTW